MVLSNVTIAIILVVYSILWFLIGYLVLRQPTPSVTEVLESYTLTGVIPDHTNKLNQISESVNSIQANNEAFQSEVKTTYNNISQRTNDIATKTNLYYMDHKAQLQEISDKVDRLSVSINGPNGSVRATETFGAPMVQPSSGVPSSTPSSSTPSRIIDTLLYCSKGGPQESGKLPVRRICFLPLESTQGRETLSGTILRPFQNPDLDGMQIVSLTHWNGGILILHTGAHAYLSFALLDPRKQIVNVLWTESLPLTFSDLVTLRDLKGHQHVYGLTDGKLYELLLSENKFDRVTLRQVSNLPESISAITVSPDDRLLGLSMGRRKISQVYHQPAEDLEMIQDLPFVVHSLGPLDLQSHRYDVIEDQNHKLVLHHEGVMPLEQERAIFNDEGIVFALDRRQASLFDHCKYLSNLKGYLFVTRPSVHPMPVSL